MMFGMAKRNRRIAALEHEVRAIAEKTARIEQALEKLAERSEQCVRENADAFAAQQARFERDIGMLADRLANQQARLDPGLQEIAGHGLTLRRLVRRVDIDAEETAKTAAALLERIESARRRDD